MIKMAKNQVCYKKTCWSTKNTVIEQAEKIEEIHTGEDLDIRIKPHSHKENNEVSKSEANEIENSGENEIRESIKNFSTTYGKKLKVSIYQNKDKKIQTAYDLNETNLKTKELSDDENSESNMDFSHEYDAPEYEEFLIEKTPIGYIKVANFYRTPVGALKKLGLIPDYDRNVFSRY